MPILFQYLLKVSISLGIMYIFYQLVLRRLTFYNHNRWYLFGYSALCFFLSFINIGPILEKNDVAGHEFVNLVPSVDKLTSQVYPELIVSENGVQGIWKWLMVALVTVAGILIIRLVVQLVSFKRLRASAKFVAGDKIKFYQVNRNIIPFSFGNSIYINQSLHTEAELKEIIRHEFVHVKQGHTADIIWSEILCIFNWYNPFAWLIRKAIRQNLEFIADHKVVANGIDKKQYQLLLLKVIGNRNFSISAPFNFSSLKKRIVMMNKIKSAKVHLLKFLFILPLLAVLLLAFRNKLTNLSDKGYYHIAGLTLDAKTEQPLKGVTIKEAISGAQTISDDKGYFKISILKENMKSKPALSFLREGYTASPIVKNIPLSIIQQEVYPNIKFVYLARNSDGGYAHSYSEYYPGEPDFEFVIEKFGMQKAKNEKLTKVDALIGKNRKPIQVIDGIPYAISANDSKAWFSNEEIKASPEFKVWVDGKIMSMEEANATIDRYQVLNVGASPKNSSLKTYGISSNLLLLNLVAKKGDWTTVDTIPNTTDIDIYEVRASHSLHRNDGMGPEHKKFFDRNPGINLLHWKDNGDLEVYLKTGKVVNYSTAADFKKFESLYGPVPPRKGSTNIKSAISPTSPVSPVAPVSPVQATSPAGRVVIQTTSEAPGVGDGSTKPLVFVDGKQWPSDIDVNIIDGDKIESVNVYKGESAINQYGNKGKDGVIAIVTKKQPGKIADVNVLPKPAYYLDGKKITKEAADLIDPVRVKSIDVLKGKNATDKYGNDGKNGVIEITTSAVPTTINYQEKPEIPAWDIRNTLYKKKKEEC